jgi:hypothetical protein
LLDAGGSGWLFEKGKHLVKDESCPRILKTREIFPLIEETRRLKRDRGILQSLGSLEIF